MSQENQRVPIRLTFSELLLVNLIQWRKNPSLKFILIIPIVMGLLSAFQGFGDRSNIPLLHLIVIFLIVVAIICILVIFMFLTYVSFASYLQWNNLRNSEEWLEVNSKGILTSDGLFSILIPRNNIKGVNIGDRFLVVLTRGKK